MEKLIGRKLEILVLDDDAMFGAILSATARLRGINVTFCPRIKDMLHVIEQRKFDVVILDYNLGDRNGVDLAPILGKTPVIVTSQSGSWLRDSEEWPGNIACFVHKRLGVGELLDQVSRVTHPDNSRRESPHAASRINRPYF